MQPRMMFWIGTTAAVVIIGFSVALGVRFWPKDTKQSTDEGLFLETSLATNSKNVQNLAFSPDSRTLASAAGDGIVRIWDLASRQELVSLQEHRSGIKALVYSIDGSILVSGDWHCGVRIWETGTFRLLDSLSGARWYPLALAISPDSRTLAIGPWDQTDSILLWDLKARRQITIIGMSGEDIHALGFLQSGSTLVSLCGASRLRLFDFGSGKPLGSLQLETEGRKPDIWSISSSPEAPLLAIYDRGGPAVHLWHGPESRETAILKLPWELVMGAAFSPDGKVLATIGWRERRFPGELRLWDVERKQLVAHIRPMGGYLSCIAYSPDGRLIATGGDSDGIIRIWSVERILEGGFKVEVEPFWK